jgi:hypothetical protein
MELPEGRQHAEPPPFVPGHPRPEPPREMIRKALNATEELRRAISIAVFHTDESKHHHATMRFEAGGAPLQPATALLVDSWVESFGLLLPRMDLLHLQLDFVPSIGGDDPAVLAPPDAEIEAATADLETSILDRIAQLPPTAERIIATLRLAEDESALSLRIGDGKMSRDAHWQPLETWRNASHAWRAGTSGLLFQVAYTHLSAHQRLDRASHR